MFKISLSVILGASLLLVQSIYSFSVTKIEGGVQVLSAYEGKKMLIITLPTQQTAAADSLLYELDTLATAHASTLRVIAVPSFEDGYTTAQQNALTQWYRSKVSSTVLITEGLYTRKVSGAQQSALFKWLTDVNQNESFDTDVTGPGCKFFISSTGLLYSVLTPEMSVSGQAVQRTLQMQ